MRTWWDRRTDRDGLTDGADYIGPFPLRRGGSKNGLDLKIMYKPQFRMDDAEFFLMRT